MGRPPLEPLKVSGERWSPEEMEIRNVIYEAHCFGECEDGKTRCSHAYVGLNGLDRKDGKEIKGTVHERWKNHIASIRKADTAVGEHFQEKHKAVLDKIKGKNSKDVEHLLRFHISETLEADVSNEDLKAAECRVFKQVEANGWVPINKKNPC